MEKIGFIGLGIMGNPMAGHILKNGYEMIVNDTSEAAQNNLAAKGAKIGTLAEIGGNCGVIFTMLPDGAVVQQVLFAENGVASTAKAGSLVVDMSSVTPVESKTCAEKLKNKGIGFLDAPVSGGEPGAINATLAFMVGGKQSDFDKASPFFDIMGSSAVLIGDSGSGSVTKLVNQVIVNMNIAVVAEALVMAVKAGVDPEKVYKAIRGGLAGSNVLDAKAPMMIARNFQPGGKISINHKDVKNVMGTAHAIDAPMPLTSQLFEIMQVLKIRGHMDDDHSGIVQYFESLAGVKVGKGS